MGGHDRRAGGKTGAFLRRKVFRKRGEKESSDPEYGSSFNTKREKKEEKKPRRVHRSQLTKGGREGRVGNTEAGS